MCGIIAVLSRPDQRPAPDLSGCVARVAGAAETVRAWGTTDDAGDGSLDPAVAGLEAAVGDLRGFAGLKTLLAGDGGLKDAVDKLGGALSRFEQLLDQSAAGLGTKRVEGLNALLVRAKDAHFTLLSDRLGNVDKVLGLAGSSQEDGHLRAAYDINTALNALDRLEVRGRDSAGLHLFVRGAFDGLLDRHADEIEERRRIDHFTHEAVRRVDASDGTSLFSFVYKVAAEVGELGDNVRTLRASISGDPLLGKLLETPGATAEVLGHTRWASVGVISQGNAHPLNSEQQESAGPYAVAALNGDVDNYQQLIRDEELVIHDEITTDAKVIPVLWANLVASGVPARDAFPRVVSRFEGSVAIGAAVADEPGRIYLALRGSGQALYVGLAENSFLVASEPYGIVEETSDYLRLDGETPADPDRPESRGQVVVLDAADAGSAGAVTRMAYDGTPLPIDEAREIRSVEITTRDIDRGDHSHYLRKEINEAPESIRKTLRGRVTEQDGLTSVALGEECLPPAIIERVRAGNVRRIRVIGQGTAAVAGQAVAGAVRDALAGSGIDVDAMPATEVSGFHMVDDMTDQLFIAISQSGTTTDTNRTVDLLRARGAAVIGIVNRRHSDLTERVDGVIYTSDGRDVEMSVASTKAFYSQVAAGLLLGEAIASACGFGDPARRSRLLSALAGLPEQMRDMLGREQSVAEAARKTAPPRRHWAIVGNGRNKIAAEEIRIKLSELCYKSIACDATEDKKHIDLSSEPLILVCAAGLEGGNASDVAKEVEIYAAHKASPVVVATDGAGDWHAATAIIRVPECETDLAFILTTMAGHLFGYHAALAIDALAMPLRAARGAIEIGTLSADNGDLREQLRPRLSEPMRSFSSELKAGRYDGVLEASTASRLSLLFRYATRALPLEFFPEDFGRVGTPGSAIEELANALTEGIEELSRPIDAIKHQAKTVTVGISRGDEALMAVPLVRAVLDSGMARERLPYRSMQALRALDAAIESVNGYTRYEITGLANGARIRVVDQGGTAKSIRSRTDQNQALRGTKNTVAREGGVTVAIGRSDRRPILLIPESDQGTCTGLVLLHVDFRDRVDANATRQVLNGYRNRYSEIRDALAETDMTFTDEDLTKVPLLRLLIDPVDTVADELVGVKNNA